MQKLSKEIPHVAILLESPYSTHSQILRGILRFTQLHSPWTLDVRMGRAGEPTMFDEHGWNASGVIANRVPPDLAALIHAHKTPLVVMNDIARDMRPVGRILCETATTTISSIPLSAEDAGFRAAELLDRAMACGNRLKRRPTEIFYTGTHVVPRRSTERVIAADALVRRCRMLMEANIGRPFNVHDLVASLDVSRRTLEVRFRAATGRSLNDEITALRIRRAKALLAKTSMTQAEIAAQCGFCDASHMSVIFRRHCSATPSAFR